MAINALTRTEWELAQHWAARVRRLSDEARHERVGAEWGLTGRGRIAADEEHALRGRIEQLRGREEALRELARMLELGRL